MAPALNVTTTPVIIDGDGRQLGGGDWGQVDPKRAEVKAAVERGALVIVEKVPEDADPAILAQLYPPPTSPPGELDGTPDPKSAPKRSTSR